MKNIFVQGFFVSFVRHFYDLIYSLWFVGGFVRLLIQTACFLVVVWTHLSIIFSSLCGFSVAVSWFWVLRKFQESCWWFVARILKSSKVLLGKFGSSESRHETDMHHKKTTKMYPSPRQMQTAMFPVFFPFGPHSTSRNIAVLPTQLRHSVKGQELMPSASFVEGFWSFVWGYVRALHPNLPDHPVSVRCVLWESSFFFEASKTHRSLHSCLR